MGQKRLGYIPQAIWNQIVFLSLKEGKKPKELLVTALEEFLISKGLSPYAEIGKK